MNKLLFLVFLILVIGIPSAYAHPFLLDSEPPQAGNAAIGTTQVIIKYSEAIEIDFSELKVFDSNGNQIDSRNTAYYEGEINGIEINVVIPVEDVESTSVLDFPATSGSSSGQEVVALKNAVTSLQKDVSSIKSQVGGIDTSSGNFDVETAYNFGVFGVSLGAAGVILAIIAMVKRK